VQRLVAGSAVVELPAQIGTPMMGYGARVGVADAHHDPLFARALYLRQGTGCLIVELDLCLVAPSQARVVRERLAASTGVPEANILVGCIHTHSAPDTGLAWLLGGRELPDHVEPIFDAAVEAGR